MKKEEITILWRAGMHARPASEIVKTANKFSSKILLKKGNKEVDCKSVINVLTLGVLYKEVITVIADGEDEDAALKAITDIFKNESVNGENI